MLLPGHRVSDWLGTKRAKARNVDAGDAPLLIALEVNR
jgi:hypothetical protein